MRDVIGTRSVGEQAVVTDAVKAAGQHVDEEAADELVGIERHHLVVSLAAFAAVMLEAELDESLARSRYTRRASGQAAIRRRRRASPVTATATGRGSDPAPCVTHHLKSVDHLVGTDQKSLRYLLAERLGGSEVDD